MRDRLRAAPPMTAPSLILAAATTVPGPETACVTDPEADEDNDGFSVVAGDCNDCDPNVNPGAIEVIVTEPNEEGEVPKPADEDCDGEIDNAPLPCDAGIVMETIDPFEAAAAIGLCQQATQDSWGIVHAQFTRSNGSALPDPGAQAGVHTSFGANVSSVEGEQLLTLSSGRARLPGQEQACNNQSCLGLGPGNAPAGFPQSPASCPVSNFIFDDLALTLTLRAPTNATGFSFDFDFYSFEYPEWVCDAYNDQFIALVDPPPEGSVSGNISFDSMNNPVSVNIAFFEVCPGCPLGAEELEGTGFGTWNDAGATSWLQTTSPITGGQEFTIRFAIWDTGDAAFDSTVLIDNFRWIADGGTVAVGTKPTG